MTTVAAFLDALEPEQRRRVDAVRSLLLEVEPTLVEHVKWNAPSFVHDGVDRFTVNIRNREHVVQLVLHLGAGRAEDRAAPPVLADPARLVRWLSDIRGMLVVPDEETLRERRDDYADVLRRWLLVR